eukprot:667933-Rhodomonas_salina.1
MKTSRCHRSSAPPSSPSPLPPPLPVLPLVCAVLRAAVPRGLTQYQRWRRGVYAPTRICILKWQCKPVLMSYRHCTPTRSLSQSSMHLRVCDTQPVLRGSTRAAASYLEAFELELVGA